MHLATPVDRQLQEPNPEAISHLDVYALQKSQLFDKAQARSCLETGESWWFAVLVYAHNSFLKETSNLKLSNK